MPREFQSKTEPLFQMYPKAPIDNTDPLVVLIPVNKTHQRDAGLSTLSTRWQLKVVAQVLSNKIFISTKNYRTVSISNIEQWLNLDHLWVLNIRWCTDLWKPSKKVKVLQVLAVLKLLFWMVSRNSQKTNNPHQAKQHKTTAPRVQMRMLFGCEPWAYPTQKVGKVRITRTSTFDVSYRFQMFGTTSLGFWLLSSTNAAWHLSCLFWSQKNNITKPSCCICLPALPPPLRIKPASEANRVMKHPDAKIVFAARCHVSNLQGQKKSMACLCLPFGRTGRWPLTRYL